MEVFNTSPTRKRGMVPTETKNKKRYETPIEEKESIRWIDGLRAAREVAEQCPQTQCVLVCDSESDIYELFAERRTTDHGRPLEIHRALHHDSMTLFA